MISAAGWSRTALVTLFAGGLAAFYLFDLQQWLSLDMLKSHRDQLLEFTARHFWTALFASVALYAGAVALSVPGATLFSLALGMLFGRWLATALIVIAASTGATLVFLAARHLFADAARRRLGARINKLIGGFEGNAFSYLLFLRLVPLFPFWLVNLVPAFTRVPTRVYVAATTLGVMPGAFVFANLGESLGRIHSTRELVSLDILVAFTLLGVFALLPIMVKKRRGRNQPASFVATHQHDD